MENCETLEETAIREVEEEVGVQIEDVRYLHSSTVFVLTQITTTICTFLGGLVPGKLSTPEYGAAQVRRLALDQVGRQRKFSISVIWIIRRY